MPRKVMMVQGSDGRAIRVTLGAKAKERIVDPAGFLTKSSPGLSKEEQEGFSNWKSQVQSGKIKIDYP